MENDGIRRAQAGAVPEMPGAGNPGRTAQRKLVG